MRDARAEMLVALMTVVNAFIPPSSARAVIAVVVAVLFR
jgi:hypothetical protein